MSQTINSTQIEPANPQRAEAFIRPLISGSFPSVSTEKIKAVGFSTGDTNHIIGFDSGDKALSSDSLSFYYTFDRNDIWQIPQPFKIEKYVRIGKDAGSRYCDGPELVSVGDSIYVNVSYNNIDTSDNSVEHIEAMINLSGGNVTYGTFAGKYQTGRKLEGRMVKAEAGAHDVIAMDYIAGKIAKSDFLVNISGADELSDRLMEEWKSANSRAQDEASRITFIPIPAQSSLSASYGMRKYGRETGGGYTAVLMNFRGNTLVCCTDPQGRELICWCEPQCNDRTSGKYLHTIFFERGSTVTLFYYHGRKSFKYRIDLHTGRISR